jgi:hypothetical protein
MPGKMMPLKLYFYSNRNIVGTGLGIGAAALAALGIIQDYWLLLVAGSYGAVALITPENQRMDVSLAREMSDREIISTASVWLATFRPMPCLFSPVVPGALQRQHRPTLAAPLGPMPPSAVEAVNLRIHRSHSAAATIKHARAKTRTAVRGGSKDAP